MSSLIRSTSHRYWTQITNRRSTVKVEWCWASTWRKVSGFRSSTTCWRNFSTWRCQEFTSKLLLQRGNRVSHWGYRKYRYWCYCWLKFESRRLENRSLKKLKLLSRLTTSFLVDFHQWCFANTGHPPGPHHHLRNQLPLIRIQHSRLMQSRFHLQIACKKIVQLFQNVQGYMYVRVKQYYTLRGYNIFFHFPITFRKGTQRF